MPNIFKSKEVYKHLKVTSERPPGKMVPVQGLYVSGEFRPPYYTEGQVHITDFTSTPGSAVSFKNVSRTDEDGCVKVLDFSIDTGSISITNYTTASANAGEDCCVKVLDFWVEPNLNLTYDWYKTVSQSAGEDCCVKVIDFTIDSNNIFPLTTYLKAKNNSTPEPILRLTGIVSENCIAENYNP